MAKILMIVGDFNEDLEVRFPQQALEMLGHEVHTVSPGKVCRFEHCHGSPRSGRYLATVLHGRSWPYAAYHTRFF